jgi:peptidoglycan/xylan/chitin deacetylase (PgdA/CDA1 family)
VIVSAARTAYARFRRRTIYRRVLQPTPSLIILRYHSVGEPDAVGRYVNPGLAVSPGRFVEHVRLVVRKFRTVVPDEIPEVLQPGRRSERLAVLITFDDGYIDNYDVAVPILLDAGARAMFYIATQPLFAGSWLWTSELWRVVPKLPQGELALPFGGSWSVPASADERQTFSRRLTVSLSAMAAESREQVREYMWHKTGLRRGEGLERSFVTPDQVRSMKNAGMAIGAHTRNHPQLDLLPSEYRRSELESSKQDLEKILGEPVLHLAYPNPGGGGTIRPEVRSAAQASGFRTAVTSVTGPIRADSDLLRLPRLGINAGVQEAQLFKALERVP